MVAYTLRMPAGIPGDINRAEIATVEPQVITPNGSANAPVLFGVGIMIDATTGMVRLPIAADTTIYGLLARPFPIQEPTATPTLGISLVPLQGSCSVLRRGYMSVLLQNTTAAAKAGPVYCRVSGATASLALGGFEAAPGTGLILVPNSNFQGPAYTDNFGNIVTEIAYNI
jgi:hypothetical protein